MSEAQCDDADRSHGGDGGLILSELLARGAHNVLPETPPTSENICSRSPTTNVYYLRSRRVLLR